MKKTQIERKRINQLVAIAMIVILAACSAGNAENDNKAKEAQLKAYKQEVHDLEMKIAALEKELKAGAKVDKVQVVLHELKTQKFEHFIDVTGSVEADQEVNVSPEASGKILEITVKEGQRVRKGAVLAVLNSETIDRNIDEVEISLELAKTTFDRQKNLWEQNIGSELQFLQAKSKKEALEKQLESLKAQKDLSVIKAPVDGTIDVIYQKQGQIASAQMPFAKLVNIQKIKVYADVAESYLTKIKERDDVLISFPAIGRDRKTEVLMIGNYIDPNNRTFRIRMDLQNQDKLIKPNMDAVVTLRDYVADEAIVIPSLLIKEDFKGTYTFVAEADSGKLRARKVYVETGVTDNNMTEVRSGLKAGEQVIAEGFSQVVDGSLLQAN